ncbi:hypothetical protein [Brucella anthropi]|uniref:hypothetical protein n=1 Tax=Brucella anthropi TaxID=529 RepID=UPI000F661AF9|nr:hypothetical protein [Brucella anthropi]RRY08833.1 hypothetical protein EGJ58_13110 [Brucella anthropi]
MNKISSTIKKLDEARFGSRDLDADVYEALGYEVKREAVSVPGFYRKSTRAWAYKNGSRWYSMQRLTDSIEDALSIFKRELPGYSRLMWDHPEECHVETFKLGPLERMQDGRMTRNRFDLVSVEQAPSLAIALCIALLRTKEAQYV